MSYVKEIDPSQVTYDSNLFQSAFWTDFKEKRGYGTQAFHIDFDGEKTSMIMVHRPCAGDLTYGYVPYGPDISVPQDQQGRFLECLSENIRHHVPAQCCFLRYDLPWPNPYAPPLTGKTRWSGPPEPRIREFRMNFGSNYWNLRKGPTDMLPSNTVVLDLRKPVPRILQGMHRKARYCVRAAFRRGVLVEQKGPEMLSSWHRLYLETAERKGIVAEELDYFRELFGTAQPHKPDLRLYLGFRNRQVVAGIILALHLSTAYYLYSASSQRGRNLTASYAVLWKAIMEAKALGYRRFDLFGIPATDDPGHPMHGLYRFKTRFGGDIQHLSGCWDYPLDVERYPILALADRSNNSYHLR